jgi:hypothetical protein
MGLGLGQRFGVGKEGLGHGVRGVRTLGQGARIWGLGPEFDIFHRM